jgi:diguanylate cyclase (GGDEF)-like protein
VARKHGITPLQYQLMLQGEEYLGRDWLEHGIAQAKLPRCVLAVMFVDLDNFKRLNDTYGHQAGDTVLQTVAMRLAHTTRNTDTISRFGGDEFLCVLTHLQEQNEIAMPQLSFKRFERLATCV